MKIGVVGLGSMGKRRVRDLRDLDVEIVGFDIREDRNAQAKDLFGFRTVDSFDALIASGVQAMVISTPPDCHVCYYDLCYQHRLPYFSEANIFTPSVSWFESRESSSGVRGYPSATWRFHPLVQELSRRIDSLGAQKINSFSHQYGGYLPDWHPWENYTDFYAGRSGTCAAREMVPFELEILVDAFGPVAQVSAIKTQARSWEANFDDTYHMLLQFERGVVGTFAIELHQVAPVRVTRISARDEILSLDLGAQELRVFDRDADSWQFVRPKSLVQNWGFHFEQVYREEIRSFVAALSGSPYPKTWSEDRHLSDVLYAAELSHGTGRAVRISDVTTAYDGISWINSQR
jgi:predicted dehydrogenase